MAIGIIGIELFQTETQGTISQGERLTLGRYAISYDELATFDTPDGRNVARAVVSVFKDGEYIGELHPRRDFYYESQQQMTIPGVRSTWENDFYVLLVDWEPVTASGATFKVYNNPLVNWLWLGGIVFILGTLIAAWPDRDPEPMAMRSRQPGYAPAKA
jgi:cytochrome c-type biogenesis protein CcmF